MFEKAIYEVNLKALKMLYDANYSEPEDFEWLNIEDQRYKPIVSWLLQNGFATDREDVLINVYGSVLKSSRNSFSEPSLIKFN